MATILVEQEVPALMRDGVTLCADVYRPADDAPHPVLLSRLPYGRMSMGPEVNLLRLAQAGYAVVIQDCRGCGASEGQWSYFASLCQEGPDGYMQNVCDGIVRARYRDSLASPTFLERDNTYKLGIDLWSTAHAFLVGHRIAVQVTSSSFPRWDRNWNTRESPESATLASARSRRSGTTPRAPRGSCYRRCRPLTRRYEAIFLDDGGVISDNDERAAPWRRLLGEFFAPVLGGTSDDWAAANLLAMDHVSEWYRTWIRADREANGRVTHDYATYHRTYRLTWLRVMCEEVGVALTDEVAALDLATQAIAYCTRRVVAPQPRAADAIRALHARAYTLYTASGEARSELDGYLSALGVRELFAELYGGDVVNTLKEGPEYYERVLAHSGMPPESSLFVDDNPIVLDWIRQTGARSALVGPKAAPDLDADHVAPSLWELSQAL